MDKFLKQLEAALEVYIVRGEAVIELLEIGNWEKASRELRDRKAAFLNYRAADSLTQEKLDEFYVSQRAKNIWKKIQTQEAKINVLLEQYKRNYEDQLRKIKKERSRISKYRSHPQNQNTFARSI